MAGPPEGFAPDGEREDGGAVRVQVSADRRTESRVSVFVEDAIVEAWIATNGRELRGPHRYAIAKIR